eukprot:6184484-Pleurochrysis_carterae.AAC.2
MHEHHFDRRAAQQLRSARPAACTGRDVCGRGSTLSAGACCEGRTRRVCTAMNVVSFTCSHARATERKRPTHGAQNASSLKPRKAVTRSERRSRHQAFVSLQWRLGTGRDRAGGR